MTVRRRLTAVLRIALAVVITALAVALGTAAPAAAHTDLLGSSPANGTVVAPGTEELMLSFAQEVVPGSASVSVVGPDGQAAAAADARVEGSLVRVGLQLTAPGAHTVSYRVVAGDGHVVTGGLTFTVGDGTAARPAPLAVPPPTPEGEGSGSGVVPWTAGAGALALALAALHGARRRRGQRSAGTPRAPESVSSASCSAAASSS